MQMAKSTQSQMESRIEFGDKQNLAAVSGIDEESAEDVEILGNATWFTIGDLVIPRDWLVSRMQELGIEQMTPNKRRTDSAFRAAARWLVQPEDSARLAHEQSSFEIRKDGRSRRQLIAQIYESPEDEEESGSWRDITLATFAYENEEDSRARVRSTAHIDEEHALFGEFERFRERMNDLFEKMQESHGGDNIHDMIYDWITRHSSVIKLRDAGAVYFVPSQYAETVESLSELCRDLNQFKDRGRNIEMHTLPVVDDAKRRDMVQQRAQIALEERLEDVVDQAIELVSGEFSVNEAVEEVSEDLEDSSEFAAQYNQLLEVEMSLAETLEKQIESASDAESEIAGKIAEELSEDSESGRSEVERDENGRFVSK